MIRVFLLCGLILGCTVNHYHRTVVVSSSKHEKQLKSNMAEALKKSAKR